MQFERMEHAKQPLIFDIKRASTNDGPGLRTVFFLKGCNLDCFWCHNPEGKRADAQIAFFREKCEGCGICKKVCKSKEHCIGCATCVLYCPAEARKQYGKAYSADALFEIAASDVDYYRATGGGVTFSGGECMLYPEFVASLSVRFKEAGISVAIDTAGAVPYAHFETVLPYADIFLYDIKALDPTLHKRGTGRENSLILENLEKLRETGKQIIIRTPVIPEFNEGDEVERITAYCKARGLAHELLPYHAMGESKEAALRDFGG